jgi:hypothetical protein
MVEWIRAKCLECDKTVLLRFEDEEAPYWRRGDHLRYRCPVCLKETSLKIEGH